MATISPFSLMFCSVLTHSVLFCPGAPSRGVVVHLTGSWRLPSAVMLTLLVEAG